MEKAFALDPCDVRIFLELDQLYKKLGHSHDRRLALMQKHEDLVCRRDDSMLEYVTLHNLNGLHQKALDLIMSHQFRPWEGAEGKISGQYKIALTALAVEELTAGHPEKAEELLEQALVYPENLGEGKLEGIKDNNIYFYLGLAKERLNRMEEAKKMLSAGKCWGKRAIRCFILL